MPNIKNWRKSSRSGGNGGECVEVGSDDDTIYIRDTATPGPTLAFPRPVWAAFVEGVKLDEFPSTL
jgi:Domain of unknown function (DUF397)